MTKGPVITRSVRFPGSSNRRLFISKEMYRSPRPYRQVLPYSFRQATSADSLNDAPNTWVWDETRLANPVQEARNKAVSRFIANYQGGVKTNLGLSALESRETLNLLTSRLGQLYTGFRAISRLDFKTARRTFGPPHKVRKVLESPRGAINEASSLYLEYLFGWLPLMQDVKQTYDTLMSPGTPDGSRFSGSATVATKFTDPLPDWFGWTMSGTIVVKCRVEATVGVSSDALSTANRYGLINPVQSLFEAAPLSFVLNWFLPIAEGLSTLTDHVGYSITNPYESLTIECGGKQQYYIPPPWGPSFWGGSVNGIIFTRQLALPMRHYPLRFKENPLNVGKATSLVAMLAGLGTRPR